MKAAFRSGSLSPTPSRPEGANRTAKGLLTTTLAMADVALDGFPIYGPKVAVNSTLEVLKAVDVRALNRSNLCGELKSSKSLENVAE